MFRAVMLLLNLSCATAGLAYMKHLELDEPLPEPTNKVQQARKYPSESMNASHPHEPAAGSEYRLSYADYQVTWESFKSGYNKQYPNEREERKRFSIFMETVNLIENHNWKYHNGQTSFYMGINQFSDLTIQEYRTRNRLDVNRTIIPLTRFSEYLPSGKAVPNSVNWTAEGYVTGIKSQGDCGACWAFSAAGAIEGQWFKHSGELVDLSVQQLIDCSKRYSNKGCDGGFTDKSFKYVMAKGLQSEASYPYVAKDMKCNFDKNKVVATITTFKQATPENNETALREAVGIIGPISVAIDSSTIKFKNYRGGVFNDPECGLDGFYDHDVLIVGYGRVNRRDYWIVKNSWGDQWGDQGYILMSRNKNNQCSIAALAYYPIV